MQKIFFLLFLLPATLCQAQEIFISSGKIEFEKKVNIQKVMEDNSRGNDWMASFRKTMPTYNVSYFDLYFDADKTLYKPGKTVQSGGMRGPDWFTGPANDNIVYDDLKNGTSISQKNVFENTFLLQDSLRNIQWKMTSELREIAGFQCHRAETIIMDSIYIIAFYTDQIIPPGGPESIQGLPGMILGMVVPRMHATWFATSVQVSGIKPDEITPPQKGQKVNYEDLKDQLQKAMKDWRRGGQRNIWQVLL